MRTLQISKVSVFFAFTVIIVYVFAVALRQILDGEELAEGDGALQLRHWIVDCVSMAQSQQGSKNDRGIKLPRY